MGGESATKTVRTAPRAAGTDRGSTTGGRAGQVLSGLLVALGCVMFLGAFGWGAVQYVPYTVPTGSMEPTIATGSRVMAQRIDAGDIRRGDVVVFDDKSWVSGSALVKRVVAVGGDTVACCDKGKLTVNGKAIDEPYLAPGQLAEDTNFPAVKVPEGRLFLLGDDRSNSMDSTAHMTDAAQGTVSRDAVRARVDAVVWPMNGMLAPATGFEKLAPLSKPGPLPTLVLVVVAGAVLIFVGAALGPVARMLGGGRRTARGR
jgi:signal peptidase I